MRIANYVKAIGDGRDSPAITAALAKVEAESEAITQQMEQVDQEIRRATIKRPTATQVQEAWGRVLEVWAVLSEEERCDLLGSLVKKVEITEKESITIELLPMPIGYSPQFALDSHLGAGDGLSSIYTAEPLSVETLKFRFKALKGGRNRTKVPRPERSVPILS